jgi:peptidoglycan/LPS O-acetylase OafA/YrhL
LIRRTKKDADQFAVHHFQEQSGMAAAEQKAHLDALTALRFFAAAGVMLYHLPYTMPAFYSGNNFSDFSIGVGFFFVLSGFVLRLNYGGSRAISNQHFYWRRFARIYPLHLLTFIVWSFIFFHSWGNSAQEKFDSGVANLLLLQSFFAGFLFNLGYNAVSWSISNEAFFYLLFPLVRRTRMAACCVAALLFFLTIGHRYGVHAKIDQFFPNYLYFFPPIRLIEFCAGILIAELFRVGARLRHATILEAAVMVVLVLQMHYASYVPQDFFQIYYMPIFSAIIWIFAHQAGMLSRALSRSRLLVLLGEASFGLYMWHHMVEGALGLKLAAGTPKLIAISLAVIVSILLSVASFKLFEEPLRRRLTNREPQLRPFAAVASSVLNK